MKITSEFELRKLGCPTAQETNVQHSSEGWHREMERAQMASWFKKEDQEIVSSHYFRQESDTAPDFSPRLRQDLASGTGAPATYAEAATRPSTPIGKPWINAQFMPGKNIAENNGRLVAPYQSIQNVAPWNIEVDENLTRLFCLGKVVGDTDRARLGVNIHAEWKADGAEVWLGDPSRILAEHETNRLVDELRRLFREQGKNIKKITLNGKLIFGARTEDLNIKSAEEAFFVESKSVRVNDLELSEG